MAFNIFMHFIYLFYVISTSFIKDVFYLYFDSFKWIQEYHEIQFKKKYHEICWKDFTSGSIEDMNTAQRNKF